MVKFGLIGLGKWGRNYIKTINTLSNFAEIKILCSRTLDSLLSLEEFPVGKAEPAEASYKEVCLNKDIDAVIIATPPEIHYEITKFALENGKHVLCEKPFVFHEWQARELDELAKKNNLCLVVDYIHLWSGFYQKIRSFGKFEDFESVEFYLENPKTNREHNGILWDWMTHEAAMALHLSDKYPKEINIIYNNFFLKQSDQLSFSAFVGNTNFYFHLNTNARKKSRSIKGVLKNTQLLQTWDTFDKNVLREVLVDFVNAVGNNVRISNAPLAVRVTRLLEHCEHL